MVDAPPRARGAQAAKVLASVFGLGYLPLAPGTWGSAAALPLWWWSARLGWAGRVGLAVGVTALAIGVSAAAERAYGAHDVQHIVIDEVAGMMWTALGSGWSWPAAALGFVLFRVFDAYKPPPVGWVDRRVGGGLGVVLDDVVAGLMAAAVLALIARAVGA